MGDPIAGGSDYREDAKAYARFCRVHRLFMVDSLEPWRAALVKRGLSDPEVELKIAAAARFIAAMADSPREAPDRRHPPRLSPPERA